MSSRRFKILMCLAAAAVLASGCAGLRSGKKPATLTAESEKRRAEMIASFESQRDAAQLQAAMNRWKEGNPAACHRALAVLVERRPNYVDARVQYGEILLSQNQVAAAEGQLREALRQAPERADVHHSLGVVLDAAGRSSEARQHFEKALELDPTSPVYQFAVRGAVDEQQAVVPASGTQDPQSP